MNLINQIFQKSKIFSFQSSQILNKEVSQNFIPPLLLSNSPLVSIVVPSYNQGAFIKETIDSILNQEYRPLEIIIIDGASTDNTIEVLKSYQDCPELKWISEPDRGVVDAVNKGFALAQGEIIGIQSSDDYYLSQVIHRIVNVFSAHQNTGLLFGDTITVDELGNELFRSSFPAYTLEGFLSKQFYIPQPSAFFRRELLTVLNGWDERYFIADTEFWLRAVFRTNVLKIDEYISKRRLHGEQRNHQAQKIANDYWLMINNSQDLKVSPNRLKRAAKAGAHLNNLRYNSTNSSWVSTYHLWMAFFYRPQLLPSYLNSPFLMPGYMQAKILGSRLKQKILRSFDITTV